MKIKKEKRQNKKFSVALVTVGIFILVGAATVVTLQTIPGLLVKDTVVASPQKPTFVFHDKNAPGWWSGGNNHPDIKDFTGDQVSADDLPVASISIGQGEYGGWKDCFVGYSFSDEKVDIDEARVAMEKRSVEGEENVFLTPLDKRQITINTYEGAKEYTLHQYEFTGSGSAQRAKGVQFGYGFTEGWPY
jgi:hypothetical protein